MSELNKEIIKSQMAQAVEIEEVDSRWIGQAT